MPQSLTPPEWASYMAQDASGEWFWYENEPTCLNMIWSANGGKCAPLFEGSWKDSVHKVK